jgi:hypothetical protein
VPAGSSAPTTIDHPTGASDVILRMEDVGGFVPIELLAMRVPAWTLYGDGTLIVAPSGGALLNPVPGPTPPMLTAKLDESLVQEILETALTQGGLAIARESYETVGIMDAPTTVFEVHAGGLDKTVRILALDFEEPEPGPDTLARGNFQELRVFLQNIAAEAVDAGDEYEPAGFVGILVELEAGQQAPAEPRPWPWDDLAPGDFVTPPAGAEVVALPEHTLTADQLARVGVGDANGGWYGIVLDGPDDKRYSLIVRPQLPDEASSRSLSQRRVAA